MSTASMSRSAVVAMMAAVLAVPAFAQGKSEAKSKTPKVVTVTSKGEVVSDKKASKSAKSAAKAARKVSTSQAVIVTRDVLIANGYQVVNVVPTGTTQVIYYRRGNRGNGRGLGPVQRIVVLPAGEIVRFQSVPEPLLGTILRRLGL